MKHEKELYTGICRLLKGDRVYFQEVADKSGHPWFVSVMTSGPPPIFYIHNSYGSEMGFINAYGILHFYDGVPHSERVEDTGQKFKHTTREGLLQAVRLTYLKTQKPL